MIVLNSPARGSSLLAVLVLSMLSAGCNGSSRDDADRRAAAAEPTSTETINDGGKKMPPMRAPGEEAMPTQGAGEVPPELLAVFQEDLIQRAQVNRDAITVASVTEQQWPDAAMGCPQPGQMYAQMIVPGYRVVLQANGNRYAYHSDRRGNFVVCSNGLAFEPASKE